MKGKVAMLFVGLIMGSAGTGLARTHAVPEQSKVPQADWYKTQGPYACHGSAKLVKCFRRGTSWNVTVTSTASVAVVVWYGGQPIFTCPQYGFQKNCTDLR